jgi:hypothetical protein
MGRIRAAVEGFWRYRPGLKADHEPLLKAFLPEFDVTYAAEMYKRGHSVTIYFLSPLVAAKESIGFEKEIALVVSSSKTVPPSILQAADACLAEAPAFGRVESLAYVLAAPAPNIVSQVQTYLSENHQSRLVVPFTWDELITSEGRWSIRARFTESLAARDLFDMQQPLATDTYYFGRNELVTDLLDRFRGSENSGLFGLRKTGKTSAVFKLRRLAESSKAGLAIYIDAQDHSIYSLRWWELLGLLGNEIDERLAAKAPVDLMPPYTEKTAGARFRELIEHSLASLPPTHRRILFILDEIEHLVPELGPDQARHWDEDFIPFWKTLRAIQTVNRGLSFLVVGVNAATVERPSIENQDNPLFALVGVRYMPSFTREEVREMVKTIGRPMGMRFDENAYTYLWQRYGGHPTLTRLACSWHHKRAADLGVKRPWDISAGELRALEDECELSLVPHVKHVVEILHRWYQLEYEMLQMLAGGDLAAFTELAEADPELMHHLDEYGLLGWSEGVPMLRIAVVGKFLRRRARAAGKLAQGARAQGAKLEAPSDWLSRVTDISLLRNTLEPKLRRYIKRTLKASLGPERWIDPILEVLPPPEVARLKGVDRDEILNERLLLSNLIAVIEHNWGKFMSLGYSSRNRLEKYQITILLKYINAHRADAHANDVSEAEVATLAVICQTLNAALDEQLED